MSFFLLLLLLFFYIGAAELEDVAELLVVDGEGVQPVTGGYREPGAVGGWRPERAEPGRDADQKAEVLDWIDAVLGKKVPRDQPFEKVLKDGQIICEVINVLQPGSVKRIQKKGSNFQLMENIAAYQKAVKKYGVPQEEIFQTADLFEARNIKQVVLSLYCLGRIAQNKGFDGPTLGPKMAEANKREFTEDQLRAGEGHVSLQYGSNQGASAAGISMGKSRSILD